MSKGTRPRCIVPNCTSKVRRGSYRCPQHTPTLPTVDQVIDYSTQSAGRDEQ